jgi:hypothetical protein
MKLPKDISGRKVVDGLVRKLDDTSFMKREVTSQPLVPLVEMM